MRGKKRATSNRQRPTMHFVQFHSLKHSELAHPAKAPPIRKPTLAATMLPIHGTIPVKFCEVAAAYEATAAANATTLDIVVTASEHVDTSQSTWWYPGCEI
jgi:hypothetical protein